MTMSKNIKLAIKKAIDEQRFSEEEFHSLIESVSATEDKEFIANVYNYCLAKQQKKVVQLGKF
jgi:hypothetical protein